MSQIKLNKSLKSLIAVVLLSFVLVMATPSPYRDANALEPATIFFLIGAGFKLASFVLKQTTSGVDPSVTAREHTQRTLQLLHNRMNTFAHGLQQIMLEIKDLPDHIRQDTEAIISTLVQNEVIGATAVLQESVETWRAGGSPTTDPNEALRTLKQKARTLFQYSDIAMPIILHAMSYELAYIAGLQGKDSTEIYVVERAYRERLTMALDETRLGSLTYLQKAAQLEWRNHLSSQERHLDTAWYHLKTVVVDTLRVNECVHYINPYRCRRRVAMLFGQAATSWYTNPDQSLDYVIEARQQAYVSFILDHYYQALISAVRSSLDPDVKFQPITSTVDITKTAVPDCVRRGWLDTGQCVDGLRGLYEEMYSLMPLERGKDFNEVVNHVEATKPERVTAKHIPPEERKQWKWASTLVEKQNFWNDCRRKMAPARTVCEIKAYPMERGQSKNIFIQAIAHTPWWIDPVQFSTTCNAIPYCRSPRARPVP